MLLPSGLWYDWWNGSILSLTQLAQHTPPAATIPHELRLFPDRLYSNSGDAVEKGSIGEIATGSFYSDDGTSFGYRRGEYLRWRAEYHNGTLHRHREHDACSQYRQPMQLCAPDGSQLAAWDWDSDTLRREPFAP